MTAQATQRLTAAQRGSHALDWVVAHAPELALFLVGVILRLSMHVSYGPRWGYDADLHWEVVKWIAVHGGQLPPVDLLFEAFHPPLFYELGALLVRLGGDNHSVQWISIIAGILRLGLLWLGLELYLPSRVARVSGLALAAILPVSVHMDGTLNGEGLGALLALGSMVLLPRAFASVGRRRWLWAAAIGTVFGVQLLTKISAAVGIAALGLVVLLEFFFATGLPWRERVARALPWSLALVIPILMTGWYFGRNVRDHGKPFVTSFDLKSQSGSMVEAEKLPFFDRRTLGYLCGWDSKIWSQPYYPTALDPHPRFFAVAIVSTFVDYYNFSFSDVDPGESAEPRANGRPLPAELLKVSQRSAVAGTVICLATVAAFFVCLVLVWRRRQWGQLAMLVTTLAAVASSLEFTIQYPLDYLGVIKSTYVQFGAAPLYATFGVAVAWASARRWRWPLLWLLSASVWAVAAYTLYCRLRVQLLPS